ncbi:MAG: aminopeptidase P family N-terminal domain-containing protein, partial [Ruminococcus sp.]
MENRIAKLMAGLTPETDAALIQSDVNRRYLTGMQSSAGTVLCFRDAAYLIIDFRYIEKARACVRNCTVIEQNNLM